MVWNKEIVMLKDMGNNIVIEGCVECVFYSPKNKGRCAHIEHDKPRRINFSAKYFAFGRNDYFGFPAWCPLEEAEEMRCTKCRAKQGECDCWV